MNAAGGRITRGAIRRWWALPPRRGLRRLISPWQYRHLRAFGIVHLTASPLAGAFGVICLANEANWWAACFLVVGALNISCGCWYLAIDRADSPPRP